MYDMFTDFVGPVVAALAVGAGLWQYVKTSRREFVRPLREAQLGRYQDACSAAALIATLPRDDHRWNRCRTDFLRLYYGPLAIFEDFDHNSGQGRLTVELAMILFKECMETNGAPCDGFTPDLKSLSLSLAHACRESLGRSWGYDLPQLRGDYQKHALAYAAKLKVASKSEDVKRYFAVKT